MTLKRALWFAWILLCPPTWVLSSCEGGKSTQSLVHAPRLAGAEATDRGRVLPAVVDEVTTAQGRLRGVPSASADVVAFKGIPYAKAPLGSLRWATPQPPEPWDGVKSAAAFGRSCAQREQRSLLPWTESFMPGNDYSEDCLTLNIWAPSEAIADASKPVPVYVYIHGGAFTGGSGEVALYDGERLARRGIVVVTLNYRLGLLGFFCHPSLRERSPNRSCGNYGLLDQVAALRWVQRNIAAFGGDRGQVTVGGQSAGAQSVHFLMASPLASGLFHRAIAQSGPWSDSSPSMSRQAAEREGQQLVAAMGLRGLSELQRLPWAQLIEGAHPALDGVQTRPIVDGWVIAQPLHSGGAGAGWAEKIPVLTGWTADEGSYRESYGTLSWSQLRALWREVHGSKEDAVAQLYAGEQARGAGWVHKLYLRDRALAVLARYRAFRQRSGAPVYGYLFEQAIPWPEQPRFGSFHSAELPYTFDNLARLERSWDVRDHTLARQVSSYWLQFIRTGNPNGANLPQWSSDPQVVMRLKPEPEPLAALSDEAVSALVP